MCRLSVNVNKLATLRNSRGKNRPDVADLSLKILKFGAHGLTVHPRPDGRHIRTGDVEQLFELIRVWNKTAAAPVEFNIEGYPAPEFFTLLERCPPDQATLVPDPPDALTSNAGWDLARHRDFLASCVRRLKDLGVRSSLFVDPLRMNGGEWEALEQIKPDRIELYTELFADAFGGPEQNAVTAHYVRAAEKARDLGVGVNAGHDLSQANLNFLLQNIPWIEEVSIGHALICEALEQGLSITVQNYLRLMSPYHHANPHSHRAER